MKRALCLLVGLSLVPVTVWAQEKKGGELTDPVEILKKVDAAAKAVKAVKYDVEVEATGALEPRVPKMKASILAAGRVLNRAPEMYFVEAETAMPGSAEVRKISGGTDNDLFFVVDHQNKKAYEDIDPAVMGSLGRNLMAGMMIEFLYETPFTDEVNGKSHELKGSKTIAGVDCYDIYVVYQAEQAPKATWCFGKKDFLPRCRTDHYTLQNDQTGTVTKTISNLVADPKLDKEAFKLKLPEGYTKTDDFAP